MSISIGSAVQAVTDKATSIIDSAKTSVSGIGGTGTATINVNTVAGSSVDTSGKELLTNHYAGNSRLTSFEFTDSSTDDNHRAWFKLIDYAGSSGGGNSGLDLLQKEFDAYANKTVLAPILGALRSGYNAMIVTGMQENLQERQAIMPTFGDSFALTFSGREPQLLAMSGFLPFDASNSSSSWYLSFVNAYKFIFRASILAKYNLILRVIFPDFSQYDVYPVSLSCSMSSDSDNLIPFSMTAYVVNFPTSQPQGSAGICPTALSANNPADIALGAGASAWAGCVTTLVNKFTNNDVVKAAVNTARNGMNAAAGGIDFVNLGCYGKRL